MWTIPEQPRMLESPLLISPPDLPIEHEAVVGEDGRRQIKNEGTEADDDSEIICVGEPLSIVGGCESEEVTLEETFGGAALSSETDCLGHSWTTDLLVFKLLINL